MASSLHLAISESEATAGSSSATQARFWARAARATAQAPKFKGPQKYNVYTKYSYIVGFILVVN